MLLPLPKHRILRIVVADLYAFVFAIVFYLCWKFFRHERFHWFAIVYVALILALGSLAENIDYIGWRDKRQPITRINLDRDEGPASL